MRKIFVLWKHLPHDSAVSRAMDPQGALQTRWKTSEHLLALISEQIDALSYMYASSHSKNKIKHKPLQHTRPELPEHLKPTVKPKPVRKANSKETLAILRGEM
jgi:hypothetical protein